MLASRSACKQSAGQPGTCSPNWPHTHTFDFRFRRFRRLAAPAAGAAFPLDEVEATGQDPAPLLPGRGRGRAPRIRSRICLGRHLTKLRLTSQITKKRQDSPHEVPGQSALVSPLIATDWLLDGKKATEQLLKVYEQLSYARIVLDKKARRYSQRKTIATRRRMLQRNNKRKQERQYFAHI